MPRPLTAAVYRRCAEALFGADWIYPMRRLLDIRKAQAEEIAQVSAFPDRAEAMILPEEWRPILEKAIREKGRQLRAALDAVL